MFMTHTIGASIRKYRKERKLTLQQVADITNLSIGIISLIERGKSNPSMDSLYTLAKALHVEVTDLLGTTSKAELRKILDEVRKIDKDTEEGLRELQQIIQPLIPSLSNEFEAAELLHMYSKTLYITNEDMWETYAINAKQIYKELHLHDHYCNTTVSISKIYLDDDLYDQADEVITELFDEYEDKMIFISDKTLLTLLLQRIFTKLSLAKYEEASILVDKAIETSFKHEQFLHIFTLYKLRMYLSAMMEKYENVHHYMNKLYEYAQFLELDSYKCDYYLYKAFIHIAFFQQTEEALEAIHKLEEILASGPATLQANFMANCKLLKASIYTMMKRYKEALALIDEYYCRDSYKNTFLPLDKCTMLLLNSYIAISYMETDNHEKALGFAEFAVHEMNKYPPSLFHKTAKEILKNIKNNV
jgi:transcriptional regulator with XRE-family HTH domain